MTWDWGWWKIIIIRVVNCFLGIFLQHSDELKNIHAHDFIFYFQIFSRGRIGDIVIIKSCYWPLFFYLVVLAVKEESIKVKRPEKGRVCVDNLHFFSLEDSSQCSESPASTVCDWAEPYCRIGSFETLSSFVNIVIFWYPFLLLIMLHSTHFPWFQIEGVWGFSLSVLHFYILFLVYN